MAKRGRRIGSRGLDATAGSIGAALGHVAARVDSWKQQRTEIALEIQKLLTSAHALMRDLGHSAETGTSSHAIDALARRKGGRPKGYRMSEETKAKLRAAWRRRNATAANHHLSPAPPSNTGRHSRGFRVLVPRRELSPRNV